ncbi:MAG: nickel ABC transporter permease [Bacillota bacterium]
MSTYLAKRVLGTIPVLVGVSILVFSMLHFVPGDPARIMLGMEAGAEDVARLRKQLGLDDPLAVQYLRFAGGALRGDLGRSLKSNRPVVEEITARFPATLKLAFCSLSIAVSVGVVAGVLAAKHHQSLLDNAVMLGAIVGVSVPGFWLGLMLIFLFAVNLRWFPVAGAATLRHLVLPSLSLGLMASAVVARITRSSVLEVMRQDYIRTARSKGLSERIVMYRHALKNALIPVVTVVGLQFGGLLGGAVIVEQVFAWPGLGTLAVTALQARDFPMVQGIVLYMALGYVLVNLIVDVMYSYLDPRIRYQ